MGLRIGHFNFRVTRLSHLGYPNVPIFRFKQPGNPKVPTSQ
jgi:hypothetical protein